MLLINYVFITILGLFLGSFYACMGYRIPNKISLIKPRSFCENCKKEIKWYMNIPFFSYIFLNGKCAFCKKKINPINFIVEIITSILFLIFFIKYSYTLDLLLALILISVLSVTIVSDFLYYYISDRVLIISFIASLIVVYFKGDIASSLISSIAMFLLFLIIKIFGDIAFKKESLGGGDIKLIALIGLVLGLSPSIFSILISSILALIYAIFTKHKKEIPFGPFLLIGALIIFYFIPNISFF